MTPYLSDLPARTSVRRSDAFGRPPERLGRAGAGVPPRCPLWFGSWHVLKHREHREGTEFAEK